MYNYYPVTEGEVLQAGSELVLFDEDTLTNRAVTVAEDADQDDPLVLVKVGEPLRGDLSSLKEGTERYFSRKLLGRISE